MRKSLLTALLAAFATVALGIGPAVSSAETVTLVNSETGAMVDPGAELVGSSNDTHFIINGQTLHCGTVKFTVEVIENEPHTNRIYVEQVGKINFPWCQNKGPGWPCCFTPTKETFEFHAEGDKGLAVFPEGVANFDSKFIFGGACLGVGIGSEEWVPNPSGKGSLLVFNQTVQSDPACSFQGTKLIGTYKLTTGSGDPVEIVEDWEG